MGPPPGHARLGMARWMLELDDPAVEREFRAYDDENGLRTIGFAQVVGIVFTAVYAGIDLLVLPRFSLGALLVRAATVCLFLVGIMAIRGVPLVRRNLQLGSVLLLTAVQVLLGPMLAMAVAGLPTPDPDHAASMAELALDMQRTLTRLSPDWPSPIAMRIGIASGPVVAGVIGRRKFTYDLWGDTVNTASRMESHGRPHRIQVSERTHDLLEGRYAFSAPQLIDVKGKGPMTTYFLLGRLL